MSSETNVTDEPSAYDAKQKAKVESDIEQFKDLVVGHGVLDVEYDLKQARDEQHAKFVVADTGEMYETDTFQVGDNVVIEVARAAMDEVGRDTVRGFVVPDYLLATFVDQFPDSEVFRQQ